MIKSKVLFCILLMMTLLTAACSTSSKSSSQKQDGSSSPMVQRLDNQTSSKDTTIMIAAAASLESILTKELIPQFEEENPGIKVEGCFDSSGKLKTQIEEGLEADLFLSAATKHMDLLSSEGYIIDSTRVDLLINKIVLIISADVALDITKFEDIRKANRIAIADPDSVPAGQYAKEALSYTGLWEEVSAKASLGTNVTEVLNWVAAGSADAGIVYATDAKLQEDKVKVVAEAPSGSLKEDVIYPIALVSASTKQEAAQKFLDFLTSEATMKIFESYGFREAIDN